MNKKNLAIIIVAAVVVVGIVAVADWQKGKVVQAPAVPGGVIASTTAGLTQTPTSTASSSNSAVPSAATQNSYKGISFSFDYPTSWTLGMLAPVSINNFNSAYQSGSVIPMGGAEIDVATTTLYGKLGDIMATELSSAKNVATSIVTVGGISCAEARYQDSFSTTVGSQNIAVYCSRGTELWKIYLAYRAGDPAANAHISDFNGVLNSMKFLPE
jgi:hypothetical protein